MIIQIFTVNFRTATIKKLISTVALAGLVITLFSCRCNLEDDKENPKEETNKTVSSDADSITVKKI